MQAYPLTPPGLISVLPELLSDEQELAPRKPAATTTVFTIPPLGLPSSVDSSVIYVAVPAPTTTTTTTTTSTPFLDIEVPVDAALITSFPSRAVTYTRSSHFRVTEGSKKLWKLAALNSCTARHRAAMARRVQQRLGAEAKEKERMKNRPTLLQDLKNFTAKPRQPLCPAAAEGNGGNGKQVGLGEGGEVEIEFIITPIRNKPTAPIAQEETTHVRRRAKNGSIKLRKLAAANMCVQKHQAATEVVRKEAERARSVKKENKLRENRIKLAIQISTMAEDCLAARGGSRRSRRKPAPNLARTFEAEIGAGVAVMAEC